MKVSVLSSQPVSLSEVKAILSSIKKSEELNFRASRTEEYASQVAKLSLDTVRTLSAKIESLSIPRLKPENIVKLVDVLPQSEDDVKLVFQSLNLVVSKENVQKVLEVLKEFS